MTKKEKKLKLTKQAFKTYFEGKRMSWLVNDTNFLSLANEYPEVQSIDPYRFKLKTIKGYSKQANIWDIPETLQDGLTVSDVSRDYYRLKFPHFKVYDFSERFDLENLQQETRQILETENNVIIFEGVFLHNDFTLRTDVLLKANNHIKVIEVKAVTQPLKEHMYDLAYQFYIIEQNNFNLDKWNWYLLTLDNQFVYDAKKSWNEQLLDLFTERSYYYNSRPNSDEFGEVKGKQNDLVQGFYQLMENYSFEQILDQIKLIQAQETFPREDLDASLNIFHPNPYLPFLKKLAGAEGLNSIFNYRGDTGFSLKKKISLFYQGYETIESVPDKFLIKKDFPISEIVSFKSTDRELFARNHKMLRLIQKDTTILNHEHIEKELIKQHLKEYKLPIYMFDFEAVKFAIPKVHNTSPYEQVPYQYSIHIITDYDFDFNTKKGIKHIEFLATERDHFYPELMKSLVRDLQAFGVGTYVSYNKSFEKMVIKKAIEKDLGMSRKEVSFLETVNEEMVDLMVPFKQMHYYHPEQKGSYSIKYVTMMFTDLNYQNLDVIVRKGDQSAAQCKAWLSDESDASQTRWMQIRKHMLKYCEYDTLSMVGIYQKLIEKVT